MTEQRQKLHVQKRSTNPSARQAITAHLLRFQKSILLFNASTCFRKFIPGLFTVVFLTCSKSNFEGRAETETEPGGPEIEFNSECKKTASSTIFMTQCCQHNKDGIPRGNKSKTQSGSISVLIGASNLIWVPSLIKVLYENVSDAILTMSKRVFGTLLSQLETRQV
jgi:hypothetical protein